jgi:hypothetical protein
MHATRPLIGLLLAAFVLAGAGCSGTRLEPGATFTLCPVAALKGGQADPRGEARMIKSAEVEEVAELADPDGTITVQVRKTQYGKATFEVTFSDRATQLVQVRKGESKDIFPRRKSQKVGVRIEVQEAR